MNMLPQRRLFVTIESRRRSAGIGDIYLSASLQSPFRGFDLRPGQSADDEIGRDLVDVDERSRRNDAEDVDFTWQLCRGRAKRYHVQLVDEAGSPRGMAKLRGTEEKGGEGLYEGPMVYKLLTWHRPKKGEQEEKEEGEEEEEGDRGERQVDR